MERRIGYKTNSLVMKLFGVVKYLFHMTRIKNVLLEKIKNYYKIFLDLDRLSSKIHITRSFAIIYGFSNGGIPKWAFGAVVERGTVDILVYSIWSRSNII